jgi:hypothetical protein
MADNPHFAFPFERDSAGKVRVVEQDSSDHIMSCEHVVVRCPLGWRDERPEFGWPFPEFHNVPLDLGPLKAALERFEPRGEARVDQYIDAASAAITHITVEVENLRG